MVIISTLFMKNLKPIMDNIKIHLSNKIILVIIRTKAIATKRDRYNKCLIKINMLYTFSKALLVLCS